MNNKAKKIIGTAAVVATLGFLTACNSFCSDQDSSSYRYGYDSINTTYFDSREDALEYANTKVPEGYKKFDLNSETYAADGSKIKLISDEPITGTNLYVIHTGTVSVSSTTAGSDGKYTTTNIIFGKNSFVQSVESTAKTNLVNVPYNSYYEDIDLLTFKRIYNEAIALNDTIYASKSLDSLTFADIYGYTFDDLMTYKNDTTNNELLQKMLKGNDSGYIGRNNSLLVRYGYTKYLDEGNEKTPYYTLEKWNNELIKTKGADYAMNSDFLTLYETTLTTKVTNVKTCIAIDDNGLYGHISTDPLNETVPITNKAKDGFWAGWGNAFSEHGFLEGLLVYPISYGVETLSHSFGMNGWGQIWAVLLVTIIIRAFFMLITLPSTISQQKMTFLQPELAKLQQKYPNANSNQYEKQRLAQAQMALYKKNKVHPFMSILVMIIQFPLFIAVWNAMTGSASLSSDSVMGLYLSDTIWNTLTNLVGWPASSGWWTALILILLMSASQVVSMMLPQWLNKRRMKNIKKTVVSQTQDQQQSQMKMMNWVMTAFVIIMGFTLPSAMGVYWFAGAIFSIIQTLITQFIMSRKKKEM